MAQADSHDPTAAVYALADELTRMVCLAQALVESGRTINLSGLDDQVGLLCAKSLDLPPDEGRGVRSRLLVLSSAMEDLSLALSLCSPESG